MSESNPLLSAADAERIVTHMNEEHPDDLVRYAEVYADIAEVQTARMTSIDAEGFDLEVESSGDATPVRIDFDTPIETVNDARGALVELAMAAREEAER